jgi:hypothetical protein
MIKKTLLIFALSFVMLNLSAQLPNDWTGDTDIETFQSTTIVHGGSYSCGVIVNSDTQANCDLSNTVAINVVAGATYKVSFWANTSQNVRITCALDWVGASATYSNTYVGPATNGWAIFEYSNTVPDGVTGVKLRLRFYDVTPGFVAPETQYVDDLQFQSPEGTTLTVSNGNFESWPNIKPEPSNYPTGFAATPADLNIYLSWIDAVGSQLPDAYLILACKQNNISAPVDGIFVLDDLNISDGTGAANVAFGAQAFSFTGLESQTTYYFKIYPYTNAATNINYKTDGTAPSAEASTAASSNVDVLHTTFNTGWENWTSYSVTGDEIWALDPIHGVEGSQCAKMSGYAGASNANEDWLVSPAINLADFANEKLSFYSAVGYTGDPLKVKISTNYTGSGSPANASWDDLSGQAIWPTGDPFWVWTNSGEINISNWGDDNVYIAFIYTSTALASSTWEVDEIKIIGEGSITPIPEPSNFPTSFAGSVAGTSITLTWVDAVGEVVPTGYLIKASNQASIFYPLDGTPEPDDLDFGDGFAAINIPAGIQTYTFNDLVANTEYTFYIFPFTNFGSTIDYKTDPYPPSLTAITQQVTVVDILNTTFDTGWEDWTSYNVTGDEIWALNPMHGIEGSQCTKMSGYAAGYHINEDWLLSPALNLADYANEKLSFYTAVGYTGDPLKVKISTNYSGSGNPSTATWTDLSGSATWPSGDPFWQWTNSGEINIAAWGNSTAYIAFVYTSTDLASSTWELDNVLVTGDSTTVSIPEQNNFKNNQISISPNPSNGYFTLSLPGETLWNVEFFELTGKLAYSTKILSSENSIDVEELPKGIYLLKATSVNTGKFSTTKLIIK